MVDAQYPTTFTDSSTHWSLLIAEELDSDGGTAGDASTVNITSLTPSNKFLFLYVPKLKQKLTSKDTHADLPGNFHVSTILGTLGKTFTIGPCVIIDRKMSEMNALDEQIETWMTDGNSRAGVQSLYIALKTQESGSDVYKTWNVNGTRQNWARAVIKDYQSEITPKMYKATFKFQWAEN